MNSSKTHGSDSERSQIGKRIRWLREARHISQQTLANNLKLDRSAVCKWESGRTKPSIEHMKLLADYFGVTPEEISGAAKNVEANSAGPKSAVERGKAFVDAFLIAYGNTPLSSFLDNNKTGGEQDVTGDSDSRS